MEGGDQEPGPGNSLSFLLHDFIPETIGSFERNHAPCWYQLLFTCFRIAADALWCCVNGDWRMDKAPQHVAFDGAFGALHLASLRPFRASPHIVMCSLSSPSAIVPSLLGISFLSRQFY